MKQISLLITACLLLFTFSSALAGPNENASLVLHVEEAVNPDLCFTTRAIPRCQDINEASFLAGTPVYAWVIVEQAHPNAGVGGARFGIQYGPSLNILNWTLCADQETPSGWPASTSGLTVTWNPGNCQTRIPGGGSAVLDGASAVVGYFYCAAYGPASLALTPHPQDLKTVLTDCSGVQDTISAPFPSRLGVAGFAGAGGYVPCRSLHQEYPCDISGPEVCAAGSTGNLFRVNSPAGAVPGWEISGNGVITGPVDQSTVTVQAGSPGTFALHFVDARGLNPPVTACSRTVTVVDPTVTEPSTWSAIKALF